MTSTPQVTVFTLGEYQTNCHVVTPGPIAAGSSCWIVDCGLQPRKMLDWIEAKQLRPVSILLTHTHLDHIAGVDAALARFGPLPLYVHDAERGFCSDPLLNLSALIDMPITCTEPDHQLRDGDVLELNSSRWRVLHTPGHSPGGVCYIHDMSKQAIVGDVLFAGSIGRHDFPTSDPRRLEASLLRLMELPDEMTIYPGHGEPTTIARAAGQSVHRRQARVTRSVIRRVRRRAHGAEHRGGSASRPAPHSGHARAAGGSRLQSYPQRGQQSA
jgi:glyoxylase-like metal-dependent hydrolase (beta-lactamase superfamily II)